MLKERPNMLKERPNMLKTRPNMLKKRPISVTHLGVYRGVYPPLSYPLRGGSMVQAVMMDAINDKNASQPKIQTLTLGLAHIFWKSAKSHTLTLGLAHILFGNRPKVIF